MLRHELLHVVAGGSHHAAAAETYHVRAPAGIILVDEDRSIRGQFHYVGVVLHAHHIDGLAQSGIHIAQFAVAVGHGIFTHIYLRALAVVAVVLVESISKPVG